MIAEAIQERGADYVLAVKDNQPRLAESIQNFWRSFLAHPSSHTPHSFAETVKRIMTLSGDAPLLRLRSTGVPRQAQQWKGLRCFAVLESERAIGDKTTREQRLYISSLAP